MGLRFFRRLHIAPGVGINVSRSGPSLTLGVRGAHLTLGPKAITKTVGLPGTGVFYTSRSGYHSGMHTAAPHPGGRAVSAFAVGFIVALAVVAVVVIMVMIAGFATSPA